MVTGEGERETTTARKTEDDDDGGEERTTAMTLGDGMMAIEGGMRETTGTRMTF